MTIWKNSTLIRNIDDWRRRAGPKSDDQWADHRSAKEVGKAWLAGGDDMPADVAAALLSHPDFSPVLAWSAEPEVKLPFDAIRGEPRNTDLLVQVRDASGQYLIAVEAKADEPFGETVANTRKITEDILASGRRTNRWTRLEQLVASLLGPVDPLSDSVAPLRYQLLTATAGVLCAAEREGHQRAVLLVHEFVTDRTNDAAHKRNAADFDAFLKQIAGRASRPGLIGPVWVPGNPLLTRPPALYIGKVTTNRRAAAQH